MENIGLIRNVSLYGKYCTERGVFEEMYIATEHKIYYGINNTRRPVFQQRSLNILA